MAMTGLLDLPDGVDGHLAGGKHEGARGVDGGQVAVDGDVLGLRGAAG